MRSSIAAASLFSTSVLAVLYPGQSNVNHTCQLTNSDAVLSCSSAANPNTVDSCCAETYGGLFLSTQFWSTYTGLESEGQLLPADDWTLHGLWPDFCNGSYTQYCDLSRQYDRQPSPNTTNQLPNGTVVPPYKGPSILSLIEPFGKYDLVAWMSKYWINQGAPNHEFYEHEFSKHGTCFSTFDVPCYGPQYVEHEEIVQFFETAILYYRRLPTWGWLDQAGIKPSNTTTYSIGQFQNALTKGYGALPYIGCSGPRYNETAAGRGSTDNGRTQISEAWYYFHALGQPQRGAWLPTNATGSVTSCAKAPNALRYPLRANGSTWSL